MKVLTSQNPIADLTCDAVVIGLFSDNLNDNLLLEEIESLSAELRSAIERLIADEEFTGEQNELQIFTMPSETAISKISLIGLGESKEWSARRASEAAGTAAKALASKKRNHVAFAFPAELLSDAVAGVIVGCQGQDLFRKKRSLHPFETIEFLGADGDAVEQGRILGESINLTRRLVNQPPNVTFPESFAGECQQVAKQNNLEIEVWDEQKLKDERCGSLLAVASGSAKGPRLVILRHQGGSSDEKPIALVGKGVTFDSGGLSLKPSDGMKTMKCDMAGAATVLGAMNAIAELNLPVNVVGLVGLVENLVGADCYKLGDVLTARSGKTIEVLNTDAEGRLVLADVLNVACNDEEAAKVVDLATLTGACVVALGMKIAGVMTNHQQWCEEVKKAASTGGERVWELPMDDDFAEEIKSDVADIKNIGKGRWGGAITAGKFLEEFVLEGTPWVHIDIAGPAYSDSPASFIDAGASGALVRTLVELVRQS